MLKLISCFFLVVELLFLVSCNNNSPVEDNKYETSSFDDSSKTSSFDDPRTSTNSTTAIPHITYEEHRYYIYSGDDFPEQFIDWCKSIRKETTIPEDIADSAGFIENLKNCDRMVIPILKVDGYKFYNVSTYGNKYNRYMVVYANPELPESPNISVAVEPISENMMERDERKQLEKYCKEHSISGSFSNEKCKWGEHYITSDEKCAAYFVAFNCIVRINVYSSEEQNSVDGWSAKYFDYFDFETVSLTD